MVQLRKKKKENNKSLKESLNQYVDESQDRDAAKARLKFMDRWAEISNCPKDENGNYDHSKIDYTNEFVNIEWYLCDPRILFKVTNDKYRAEGLMMLPQELRETYYKVGPGNSKPYSEIYMGVSKLKHIIKKEVKKNKGNNADIANADLIDTEQLKKLEKELESNEED